jgi:hypothetical protein
MTAQPLVRFGVSELYQAEYADLAFKCDHAMREHFIARSKAVTAPSKEAAVLLSEAEVALIDCHDYDRLRKSLLRVGMTEVDLSAMSLIAIEAKGKDIREIVRIHEIRY